MQKNIVKTILSLVLVFAFLVSFFPVSIIPTLKASAAGETIAIDEVKSFKVTSADEAHQYTVTGITESADYVLIVDTNADWQEGREIQRGVTTDGSVSYSRYDFAKSILAMEYFDTTNTYTLNIRFIGLENEDVSFKIVKRTNPSSTNIYTEKDELYVGMSLNLYSCFSQESKVPDMTFSSDDTSVLDVVSNYTRTEVNIDDIFYPAYSATITAKANGTATITAETDNHSFSATKTITVTTAPKLEDGQTLSFTGDDELVFIYTPSESGVYRFDSVNVENTGMGDLYLSFNNSQIIDISDPKSYVEGYEIENNEKLSFETDLVKDHTYLITTQIDAYNGTSPSEYNFDFCVSGPYALAKESDYLGFTSSSEESEGPLDLYIGDNPYIRLNFVDTVSKCFNNIVWSSSDPTVVDIGDTGPYGATLEVKKASSTPVTISATINGSTPDAFNISFVVNAKGPIEMTLGQSYTIENKATLTFTPQEDGIYKIYTSNTNATGGEVFYYYDHNLQIDDYIDLSGFQTPNSEVYLEAKLEKGKEYTIVARYNIDSNYYVEGTMDVTVVKCNLPTSVTITKNGNAVSTINTTVGGSAHFILKFNEGNAVVQHLNDIVWSSTNPQVVSITEHPNSCVVDYVGEGTTTITATINTTLVATLEVTVVGSLPLLENVVSDEISDGTSFKFTPTTSGIYAITTQDTTFDNPYDTYYSHCAEVSHEENDGGVVRQVHDMLDDTMPECEEYYGEIYLTAGREYTIKTTYNYYGAMASSTGTYKLKISKLSDPTSISIDDKSTVKYVGVEEKLSVKEFGTNCAKYLNAYTWSSSDDKVATVSMDGEISYVGTGTVTLTAKYSSNPTIETSKTYEVKSMPTIKVGQILSCVGSSYAEFTPTSTGVYKFVISNVVPDDKDNNHRIEMDVKSKDGEYVEGYSFDENEERTDGSWNRDYYYECRLIAGKTYIVSNSWYDYGEFSASGIYDLSVFKPSNPKDAKIGLADWMEGDCLFFVGSFDYYEVIVEDLNSIQYLNNVTWSVDDESVAELSPSWTTGICVSYVGYGTTTLRAKVNGKLVLEKEITISNDYPTLFENKAITYTAQNSQKAFKFTPDKDGTYIFTLKYPTDVLKDSFITRDIHCFDSYGSEIWWIAARGNATNDQMQVLFSGLEADNTYRIFVTGSTVGEELTIEATRRKVPTSISIEQTPTKLDYYKNADGKFSGDNEIDLRGLVINIIWDDGTSIKRKVDDNDWHFEEYDLTSFVEEKGGKTYIALYYGGVKTSFEINLIDTTVTSMEVVECQPVIEGYNYYDGYYGFNDRNIRVKITDNGNVYYSDDEDIGLYNDYECWLHFGYNTVDGDGNPYVDFEGYDNYLGQLTNPWTVGGTNEIVISYKGYTINYNVPMEKNTVGKIEVVGNATSPIAIDTSELTKQYYAEKGDASGPLTENIIGLKLRVWNADLTDSKVYTVDNENFTINGFEVCAEPVDWAAFEKGTNSDMVISYLGKTCDYHAEYLNKEIEEIKVISSPKIEIFLDYEDKSKIISYEDADGVKHDIWVMDSDVSYLDGTQLQVVYKDGTKSDIITVNSAGNHSESILVNGYMFTYFNELIGNDKAEALACKNFVMSYMGMPVYIPVTVKESKPVDNFELTSDGIKASVNANTKEATLEAAKQLAQDGDTVETKIEISKEDEISSKQKDIVFELAALDDASVQLQFSVDISYDVNGQPAGNITETDDFIEITIEIPVSMRGRSIYTIYRDHNGVVEPVESTVSADGTKITFKSDKFSDYFAAASDSKVSVTFPVESYNQNRNITVKMLQDDKVVYNDIFVFENGAGKEVENVTVKGIVEGTYDVIVEKDGCKPVEIKNVVVGTTALTAEKVTLLSGDLDGNGVINDADIAIMIDADNYYKSAEVAKCEVADLDGDGIVNEKDLELILSSMSGTSVSSKSFVATLNAKYYSDAKPPIGVALNVKSNDSIQGVTTVVLRYDASVVAPVLNGGNVAVTAGSGFTAVAMPVANTKYIILQVYNKTATSCASGIDVATIEFNFAGESVSKDIAGDTIRVATKAEAEAVLASDFASITGGTVNASLTWGQSLTPKTPTISCDEQNSEIAGTLEFGSKLSADLKDMNAPSVKYQWYRGSTAISGATGAEYTLVKADIGSTIKVVITADGYDGSVTLETATAVTKAHVATPTAPEVDGNGVQGTKITISNHEPAYAYAVVTDPEAALEFKSYANGVITGLASETKYYIFVKSAETETQFATGHCEELLEVQTLDHDCVFDKKVKDSNYLKSAATCTSNAIYYYSCQCGEKGTETFEAEGTKLNHTFDQKNTAAKYLKSAATCTSNAVYFYSCTCGEKGTTTFEAEGTKLNHTFNQKNTAAKYLKSSATCTKNAVYYYSCECGEKGTETFEAAGTMTDHIYIKQRPSSIYLKSAATCTEKAVYYKSCECGKAGTATFEYGEVDATNHNYVDGVCTRCTHKATTTVEKIDGTWYYTVDGEIDTSFTGFETNKNGNWYVKNGVVAFDTTSVIKNTEDGKWYNVVGSKVTAGPTVAKNANGWWYIDKNGVVDFNFTGFAKNKNGTWYLQGGKVSFKVTNVIKNTVDGKWYNVVGSKVTAGPTVAKNSNGWWYIDKNGVVDFKYTGLASNKNGTWYVKKGKVDFKYNGTYKGYKIKNSKVVK